MARMTGRLMLPTSVTCKGLFGNPAARLTSYARGSCRTVRHVDVGGCVVQKGMDNG